MILNAFDAHNMTSELPTRRPSLAKVVLSLGDMILNAFGTHNIASELATRWSIYRLYTYIIF